MYETARAGVFRECARSTLAAVEPLEANSTAVLFMDYQDGILARIADQRDALIARAASVLAKARSAGALVVFVRVAFRPGYPEIGDTNPIFTTMKQTGRLLMGSPETRITDALAPRENEPVVDKHRVGAFGPTALEPILRAHRIGTLVLLGVSTSGVVLSTVRHAADADYRLVVVADGCADADPEVHRVLTTKVFPRQATVVSCDEVIAAL